MSLIGRMRIYTVHIRPELPHAQEKPIFVREGFNIWAFLFLFVWSLSKRMWLVSLLLVGAYGLLIWLMQLHLLHETTVGVLQLTLQVIAGFHANDWYRAKLAHSGHIVADITTGTSPLQAEQRYFERYLAAA